MSEVTKHYAGKLPSSTYVVLGTDYDATQSELAALRELQSTLFSAIEHGDEGHKKWLRLAIDAHFSGAKAPEYVPSGKDDMIAALREELEREKRYVEINANSAHGKHKEGQVFKDERDALREELADLQRKFEMVCADADQNMELKKRLADADRRNAELEKDAQRYRWLRDPDNQEDLEPDSDYMMPPIICGYAEHEDILSMDSLDKAIDAALTKPEEAKS